MNHLNEITPGDIFKVSKPNYDLLNKYLSGQMTSVCFARKEGDDMLIKPATRRDLDLMLNLFKMSKIPYSKYEE